MNNVNVLKLPQHIWDLQPAQGVFPMSASLLLKETACQGALPKEKHYLQNAKDTLIAGVKTLLEMSS
jgi:hypothetical protein